MAEKKDKGFLADTLRRLGLGKQADEIEKKLQNLGADLDKAKIIKKNVRTGNVTKAMLDGLYADIDKLIMRHLGAENTALRDEIVATVLSSAMAESTPTDDMEDVETESLDEVMTEEMMDGEEVEEETVIEEEMMKRNKKEYDALRADLQTVAKSVNELTSAFGGFITEVVPMMEVVSELAPLAKEAPAIAELQKQVKSIQAKMSSAPRKASESPETRVSDTLAEIVKQAGDEQVVIDPILKIPVVKRG